MRPLFLAISLLAALPALAQKDEIFGKGSAPVFREENMDRRFAKSRLAKMLVEGTDDPACVELLGGLFTALAEIGPMLHKKDENFILDPILQEAVQTQLTTPAFPAMSYLVSMVRRVMIEKHLPDEWYETAKNVNRTARIIDLSKLKMLNDGVVLADSAYFTIPLLKDRYLTEVKGANSAVTTDVAGSFRDAYIDRQVVWPGAVLIDAGLNTPKGKKRISPTEMAELVAILQWLPPDPRKTHLDLLNTKPVKPEPIELVVKLAAKQYIDLEKVAKGERVLVKGKFWEMNKTVTQLLVKDAVLFEDRDWTQGVVLGNPADIARCSAAVNELTGLNPVQPGGFKH